MCGINGILNPDQSLLREAIVRMNSALAHRGPDDEGLFVSDNLALGHRRLSIIDLSAQGHQPMHFDNGRYSIVYNGELYNFKEIRSEILASFPYQKFSTQTDTEVILAAYVCWGGSCLDKFRGMFAFAIYDRHTDCLFMARDRMGIKPLYYYKAAKIFVFSSEIRALLQSGLVPRKLDAGNLADYLRYQTVHAPNTILKDVFMLMPGHFAKLDLKSNEFKITCYWYLHAKVSTPASSTSDPNVQKSSVGPNYAEAKEQVNKLFTQAIERRLIADVPFGAFLSGGIDSSAVVAVMSRISTIPVKTFSVSFYEKEYSEEQYSKRIAEKFHTDHCDIKLSAVDFKKEIPSALKAMDHPSGDGPNSYVVSKYTKQAGITMALSGLGGDELFGGYAIFKRMKSLQQNSILQKTPLVIRKMLASLIRQFDSSVAGEKMSAILSLQALTLQNTYPVSRQVLMDDEISKLITRNSADSASTVYSAIPANIVQQMAGKLINRLPLSDHLISAVSILEMSSYMQNVLLRDTDQMSMANALEVRVPFLDHELVEYVLGLNDKLKYPHTPKKLFVDAMGDLLPSEIVNRPKMGFSFPWQQWLKTDLRQFCEERIYSLAKRFVFNEIEVIAVWKRFLNDDKRITWSRVWHLVVLENWLIENKIDS